MKTLVILTLTLTLFSLTGAAQVKTTSDYSFSPKSSFTESNELDHLFEIPKKFTGDKKTITIFKKQNEHLGAPAVKYNHDRIPFNEMVKNSKEDNGVFTAYVKLFSFDGGSFQFARIAESEVYYGVWSGNNLIFPKNPTAVFYSGVSNARKLPSTTVTYAVQGINAYSGLNTLSGTLTASFDQAKPSLTGGLENDKLKLSVDSRITKKDASFLGTAVVKDKETNTSMAGESRGSFFGKGERSSLAGIAVFNDYKYNTAFGGALQKN